MPVSNFAPELLEVYRRAAQEELEITFDSQQDAERVRFRLHNLRKAMRLERHHMLAIAEGVTFSLKTEAPNVLIARPADKQYIDALHRAGITVEEPDDETSHLFKQPTAQNFIDDNTPSTEAALKHFMGKTNVTR